MGTGLLNVSIVPFGSMPLLRLPDVRHSHHVHRSVRVAKKSTARV
jgi:hypothetical protein